MPKQERTTADERLRAKAEQLGIALERLGMSPMNARALGFLLVAEPPYKDFYEIPDFSD